METLASDTTTTVRGEEVDDGNGGTQTNATYPTNSADDEADAERDESEGK